MFKSFLNPFYWRLTLRFIFNLKNKGPAKIFGWICLLGIALTVFMFFSVNAVITGYQIKIKKTLLGMSAPLFLKTPKKELFKKTKHDFLIWHEAQNLELNPQEHQEFFGMLSAPDLSQPLGVKVRTVTLEQWQKIRESSEFFAPQSAVLSDFFTSSHQMIVGKNLFHKFPPNFFSEDSLDLIHPFADVGPTGEFEPQKLPFEVLGVLSSGIYEIDEYTVLISPKALERFWPSASFKWVLELFPKTYAQTLAVQKEWAQEFKEGPRLESFYEQNKTLVKLMQIEKVVVAFLFVLLFLIATANLASLMQIFSFTHLRSLMILKAMGLSLKNLRVIFWQFGLFMGGLGSILGLLAGGLFVLYYQAFPYTLPETYSLGELPLHFDGLTFFVLMSFVPFYCVAITYASVKWLYRQSVVDVLRKL